MDRIVRMWFRLVRRGHIAVLLVLCASLLTFSGPRPQEEQDRVRAFTRSIEFEYLGWTLDAAMAKARAAAAGLPAHMDRASQRIAVSDYLQVAQKTFRAEGAVNRIFADPAVENKAEASSRIQVELTDLRAGDAALSPVAESVLQGQVAAVLASMGLAPLGEPLPAVLFRETAVPDALVVSARGEIRQIANISVLADLPIDQQAQLEQRVEAGMNVSALVVPVGGVGVYPTMIMRTTDRSWLVSTIAHEWTHNFLTLRPLGLLYDHTPELRTMNETTADIVGTEVGREVLRRFYGEMTPATLIGAGFIELPGRLPDPHDTDPPAFDFRSEMHTTRTTVDTLLASGRIDDAEAYMERRRRDFVQNGYSIRRLNQAYFAFYGAYAEIPGGAAGKDPVGPAVRQLRAASPTLAEFVNRISWMTSFEQLKQAVGS